MNFTTRVQLNLYWQIKHKSCTDSEVWKKIKSVYMLTNVLHNKGVKYEHYSEIKYANKTTN